MGLNVRTGAAGGCAGGLCLVLTRKYIERMWCECLTVVEAGVVVQLRRAQAHSDGERTVGAAQAAVVVAVQVQGPHGAERL